MFTTDGSLKVADFGIASILAESQSRVSLHDSASGTPPYMSPQQLQGARPSHLDDLYALGALLFELLTGKPPFFRGNIPPQVIDAVPPSMNARREEFRIVNRAPISETWEEVIAACLAKEPEQRPQSAGEVQKLLKSPMVRELALVALPIPSANMLHLRAATPSTRRNARNWGVGIAIVVFAGIASWFARNHRNLLKGPNLASIDPDTGSLAPLFHPRTQQWTEHFGMEDGRVHGLTAPGRTTVFLLQMNAPHRAELRLENTNDS